MQKITTNILLFIAVIGLIGCSSSNDDVDMVPDKSAQALFVDAREALESGLFQRATELLSTLDARFPYGAISHQVQLDLLYAYYKMGDTEQGIALADRFLRLNPDHQQLDYVYYMKAQLNLLSNENLFQDLVGIDRADRDPKPTREAFTNFKTILTNYPDSKYAADARKHMLEIKSSLARYELAVAKFYFKREAYVSAANRGRYILKYYSPSDEVEGALEIMIASYEKLGLTDLQKNAQQVLAANYPNNPLVR